MPTGANKKRALLYVLEVLKEYTDEEHPISYERIIQKIKEIYGVELERKFIGSCIADLDDVYGCVGGKGSRYGCYYKNEERLFRRSEATLLIDLLFPLKGISSNEAKALAAKILSTMSEHERKDYDYISDAENIIRSDNKELFANIERICKTIVKEKQISFRYTSLHYNTRKKEKELVNQQHVASPYALLPNNGRYYLICQAETERGKISTFKVDKIDKLKILDEPIDRIEEIIGYENGFDDAKYVNEHPLFLRTNGKVIPNAKLILRDDSLTDTVVEWFGDKAEFRQEGDDFCAFIYGVDELALKYFCLRYGEVVELFHPFEVRKMIKTVVNAMKEKYDQ